MDADGSFAWSPHAMANRISYALDLTGPSILLDTACSSSLNGLHLAISAIERGECEAALVGAAQINREYVFLLALLERKRETDESKKARLNGRRTRRAGCCRRMG
jgi:3-oxoacyl-(acyl-carrier-protein) synthase